jgi:flagellar hook-length control protein FliK
VAAALPAATPVTASFVPPAPGAKAATPGAGKAVAGTGEAVAAAATAPTDTPKTAAVQAATSAATSIAAAAEPKAAEPLDADAATSAPALQPVASALPAAADRAAASSNATPVLSVAPPVGSHEWGPAIGQQMIRMSASGHQVAELNLNPAGLGPLKVTLTMGDDQAQAMFVSAHEGVRKAVEAALPQLRTTLADQGISLGHTSVGAESRQPSPQGGFAEQNPGRSSGQPAYPGAGQGVATASAAAQPGPLARAARAANAGLDTFA